MDKIEKPKGVANLLKVPSHIKSATKEELRKIYEETQARCAEAITQEDRSKFFEVKTELEHIVRRLHGPQSTSRPSIGSNYRVTSLPTWCLVGVWIGSSEFVGIQQKKEKLQDFRNTSGESRLESLQYSSVLFTSCSFKDCVYENLVLTSCVFRSCKFNNVTFKNCEIERTTFEDCKFISKCSFKNSRMETSKIKGHVAGVDFTNVSGFVGDNAIDLYEITGSKSCRFGSWIDVFSWQKLKYLGSLPLFGVSYGGIFGVFLLALASAWVKSAEQKVLDYPSLMSHILLKASELTESSTMIPLFLSLVSVAIAATLYRVFCPPEIKQYTLAQWTIALKEESLRYQHLAYRIYWIRLFTFMFYLPVIYLVYLFIQRIYQTTKFLFSQLS